MTELSDLLSRAERVLERLEAVLPGPAPEPDWEAATAFRWQRRHGRAELKPVRVPHRIRLADLQDVDQQKTRIERNTRQFLAGHRANNVLLTGARGTGKSSLIKALLNEFAGQGLRVASNPPTVGKEQRRRAGDAQLLSQLHVLCHRIHVTIGVRRHLAIKDPAVPGLGTILGAPDVIRLAGRIGAENRVQESVDRQGTRGVDW